MTVDGRRGFRSYEVYQRERVGETTNLVNPRDLIADDYLGDPFTVPGVLRENYPCFRDWVGNRFWLTRYDDVTSVFVDDANFATRLRMSAYGGSKSGHDLGAEPEVQQVLTRQIDAAIVPVLDRTLDSVPDGAAPVDLVSAVTDQLAHDLFAHAISTGRHCSKLLELARIVRGGTGWNERDRVAGQAAFADLVEMLELVLAANKGAPERDMVTALAELGASAADAATTLVELDTETLPASLANLWCLLLTNQGQLDQVVAEPRLMKFAYLEALRHSPPTATTDRYTKHEVERFGRLLPQGALVHLSAAAANRDPRQFVDPGNFDVTRKDLSQREPRGQYRADGLPAPIVFGHGKPSVLPARPKESPRSRFALTLDTAVAASLAVLERFPAMQLAPGAPPSMRLDRLGGTYRCRDLSVNLS